ncbi:MULTISPECIES: hypothetical protein [Streptomyces]|uniref:Transposase DDE domain protein n=1 Tax=Streptomyces chartreusis NRRL 3882 TaxID=1079985 RepID=A0A2N9BLW0_STRCX|nr:MULTISPECIES: hypothetical protein [Streptomyces]SOR84342.1 hypothetical protein SCNRRL3882_7787 [Streptomyces chartreusis NRRL 3882]
MVLLDGTLVRTRRRTGTDNRKNHGGKHKAYGLLFLALTDERGNLIWISSAGPGRASEITAARHDHITRPASPTPRRRRTGWSAERAAVEHGFANLKTWRILTKGRMNVHHATTLLRAARGPRHGLTPVPRPASSR